MENDVLKNKIAPWQEHGRWYHGVIDFTTNQFDRDKTDEFLLSKGSLSTAGGYFYVGFDQSLTDYHIVDLKRIFHNNVIASATTVTEAYLMRTNGTVTVRMCAANSSVGACEFWIFAYIN